MKITYLDICIYILNNRRKDAFLAWNLPQIAAELIEKTPKKLVAVSLGNNGIDGVCIAQDVPELHALMIGNVLTTSRSAIKNLIDKYHEWWPDYELRGIRHGQLRIYHRTNKLIAKLYGK